MTAFHRALVISAAAHVGIIGNCAPCQPTDSDGGETSAVNTLQIYPSGNLYGQPVINLTDSESSITISFDELADTRRYLRYELIHCDADWNPEDLPGAELTDGINEGSIDDYAHSRGTVTQYVNYRLQIPNGQVRPKLSGNWIIRIYDEENPGQTIAEAPFMISEDKVKITGSISGRTDRDYNTAHQQLDIAVDIGSSDVRDPMSDYQVRVSMNGRSDDIRRLQTPQRLEGTTAIYAHNDVLIFEAGKEYRRFETVATNYPGMRIAATGFSEPWYLAEVQTDFPRSESGYEYDSTQHGRYTVAAEGTDNPDIEAEYVRTLFTLNCDELPGVDLYIEGELTGRKADRNSRMTYNPESKCYERELLLKQGSYNYQYATLTPSGALSTELIEGNSYQTRNEYGIAVYYKAPGTRHTRLLGYTTIRNNE